jgi:hypothetical protein
MEKLLQRGIAAIVIGLGIIWATAGIVAVFTILS